LINAISSNLSQDFGSFTSKISRIRFSQMISAFIALLGIFCSFYFNNIVDLLVLSYELSVSCLFVPIVFALYRKQGNKLSATLAILCGVVGFLLGRLFSLEASKEIFSLGLSLSGYCAGEWVFSQKYVSANSLVSVEKR
jgi:SSS family solute:Na+ symporter